MLGFVHTLACGGLFVASLYAIPASIRQLPRDDPTHIKYRLVVVCFVMALAPILAWVSLLVGGAAPTSSKAEHLSHQLGISPACFSANSLLLPVTAVVLLFAGPLLQVFVDASRYTRASSLPALLLPSGWSRPEVTAHVASRLEAVADALHLRRQSWLQNFRALVFAPVAEEWVFRACVLPVLLAAGASPASAIFGSAAAFGLAHLHHGYELLRQGHPPAAVALTVAAQFGYTTLFGCIAAFLLLHTGSIVGVILAHSFCNMMGFPDMSWMQCFMPPSSLKADPSRHPHYTWRWLLLVTYVAGVAAFFWFCSSMVPACSATDCACALRRRA